MSHQPPYHDAEGEYDSADVDELAQTVAQTHISYSSHPEVPRTLDAEGAVGYTDEHADHYESGDAEGSHTFGEPVVYGVSGEGYDDEEYDGEEYDGEEYDGEEYDGEEYDGEEYDDEEYAQAGQEEETLSGAFNPEAFDPRFHLDPAYQVCPDEDWFVGSIVMVPWAEPKGQSPPKGKQGGTSLYTLRELVHQSFRRMVVVKPENGSSFCCPISTYGAQGCKKSKCKPEKHGVIYDDNLNPETLKDEKKLGFKPVGATMYAGHTLDRASRLNYGNGFWVQHNIPVMFIGHIPADVMKRVKSAYKRFITEGSEDETERAASSSKSKSKKSKKEAMRGDWNETRKKKKDGEGSNSRSKRR
ncbi:uncharacterized protein J7T54_000725 [Emericellopsis cladophorae]|uniref:DUF6590 domain-containing protein n=1 Tax=Emericellopsis cladophorae TaxID=2686198 RepID=A0A9P9Y404_9HYPO|nr:uncharacterized protein J7T54_000725 [Emericellopsis cladophorae]KAI6783223.1 hypothetical protein J7T54_000725 [Emericellopsis cladophorae]